MEEIPELLSREKVTTEEKMPQRSDCPLANNRLGRTHHGCGEVMDKQDVTMPVLGSPEARAGLLHGLGDGRSLPGTWLAGGGWEVNSGGTQGRDVG